jgi:DNA polymerase III, epsilon subunit, Proteobacterial
MLREIVFDTETTGVRANDGDRLVEIGCVELLNHIPSGKTYHVYINPERSMPVEAFDIHGLSEEFLSDKPKFAEIADSFRDFIGDSRLIAHNATFDIGFLNAEFARTGHPPIFMDRVLDTLMLARRKHPGAPNSLDALCARYGIDNSRRTKHGALLDSEILAEVYLELIGGRQANFNLDSQAARNAGAQARDNIQGEETMPHQERVFVSRLTDHEAAQHRLFVSGMGDKAIWNDYLPEEPPETA